MDISGTLCQVCLGIVRDLVGGQKRVPPFTHPEPFTHHATVADWQVAVQRGCRFCSALWNIYSEDEQQNMVSANCNTSRKYLRRGCESIATECEVGSYSTKPADERDPMHLSITVDWGMQIKSGLGNNMNPPCAQFQLIPCGEEEVKESSTGRLSVKCHSSASESFEHQSPHTTWSSESCDLISCWIHQCSTHHKRCNVPAAGYWQPTRLLDLSEAPENVRVVETGSETTAGGYVVLSHRWCEHPPLLFTRGTEEQLKLGIPKSMLPQTVQDAVTCCQALGVRYLWADIMCIRQHDDDLEDWKREAMVMHKVYGNCFFHLMAIAATDTSYSFFGSRDPDRVAEMRVTTALDSPLELDTEIQQYRVIQKDFPPRDIETSALIRRGWVLQERLLSPRTVHFAQEQVYWECRELIACETYPNGSQGHTPGPFKLQDPRPGISDDLPDLAHVYWLWGRIVWEYSRCHLTNERDKLVALAGIASKMEEILNDEYVAGLWRWELEESLLWKGDNSQHNTGELPLRPRRYSNYTAPTFSWAAIDGPITPLGAAGRRDGEEAMIKIIHKELVRASEASTGPLREGCFMTIRCILQKLAAKTNLETVLENSILPKPEFLPAAPAEVCWDENTRIFEPVGRTDLYCVPVFENHVFNDVYHLLLQVVDAKLGIFRRIGMSSRFRYGHDRKYKQEWKTKDPCAAELPCMAYEDGWHTIKII